MDFTPIITAFQQAKNVRGIVADVARQLGLSHEHVRLVAAGKRTSARVARALASEYRKRQHRQNQRTERAA
jgi:hypothetical protein